MTKTTLFMGADEVAEELGVSKPMAYKLMVTSKNPQNIRQIEAFSIIGQILTRKQCFGTETLP